MKIVIIGGHLSPALSIIENLKNGEVFFVGRKYAIEGDKTVSLEYQIINNLKIPFFELNTARFQRKFTRYTLSSFLKLPVGFLQSVKILKKIGPDVVVGFGGYVSIPVVISAYFLKIPVVLHEQTLEAGFANKILAFAASKICISWESSFKFFPKAKTLLTGLPIKKEIIAVKKDIKNRKDLPFIYITGGSLGSHKINTLVYEILPRLLENFYVFHQTGDSEFKDYEKHKELKSSLKEEFSKRYEVVKYLKNKEVTEILSKSDIVISRAGVNTIAELLFLQKPAFLIPIPFSQRNEQLKNALVLKNAGIGEIGEEKTLTPEIFLGRLLYMKRNLNNYKINSLDKIPDENASYKIIKVLQDVAKKKKT
ncbi:MAG: hypothetical protein COU25_00390 [Candidatus Levybacteria bacterium CG10_big_fil_rev_8_21_14_0_10_35_13]|nr:MAG: hypothetical protein COU25_00390 [Candidatus Levybacteria bacterium CG10_big_fil_rev_8_21_14_0_10_35_13]